MAMRKAFRLKGARGFCTQTHTHTHTMKKKEQMRRNTVVALLCRADRINRRLQIGQQRAPEQNRTEQSRTEQNENTLC